VTASEVTAKDRDFLRLFCPSIKVKDPNNSNTCPGTQHIQIDVEDINRNPDETEKFIQCLMRHIYSGNHPIGQGIGPKVSAFIKRLEELDLHKPRDRSLLNQKDDYYYTSHLVRSVATQLAMELQKMYTDGTIELRDQVRSIS